MLTLEWLNKETGKWQFVDTYSSLETAQLDYGKQLQKGKELTVKQLGHGEQTYRLI